MKVAGRPTILIRPAESGRWASDGRNNSRFDREDGRTAKLISGRNDPRLEGEGFITCRLEAD
jgi:hypothetical protein